MHERDLYAAHPINTYGTPIEAAYIDFLRAYFREANIIDPNGEYCQKEVERVKQLHCLDPVSGTFSETLYNTVGGKKVMEYFTELVRSVHAGAGLALPMERDTSGEVVFALPAGVAKELSTIHKSGRMIFVVTARDYEDGTRFRSFPIKDVRLNNVRTNQLNLLHAEREHEELFTFVAEDGTQFEQLTVDETRRRIYTKRGDGWDRKNPQPYFLPES